MDQHYIYVYTNKLNGHQYVGQTNNIEKRKSGHKSDSFNPNSHSYNYPLHNAIRKYGIENFNFEIIETVNSQEKANEREIYWIEKKKSHISYGGYNILWGGDGHKRGKVPWEELLDRGKVFTAEEILTIQQALVEGAVYNDLIEQYKPRLTRTFLSNLNHGTNYKNPNLDYPLKKDFSGEKGNFSKEEIAIIKQEIKDGIVYSEICKRHGIASLGFISMINTGKYYYDKNETYPLIKKGCADKDWIIPCIKDILFSSKSLKAIAEDYSKAESTIKKLGQGRANKQPNFIYPLRSNLEENQKIFKAMYS